MITLIQMRLSGGVADWAQDEVDEKGIRFSVEEFWRAMEEEFPIMDYQGLFFGKLLEEK